MRSPKTSAASPSSGAETTSWYSMVFSALTRFSAVALMTSVVTAHDTAAPTIMRSPNV